MMLVFILVVATGLTMGLDILFKNNLNQNIQLVRTSNHGGMQHLANLKRG